MVLQSEAITSEATITPLAKLQTVDDLLTLPNDDFRYELHAGELIQLGTSSRKHTKLAGWIVHQLWTYLEAHPIGGEVTGADGTYKLGEHDTSVPDAAYVSAIKAANLPKGTVFYPFAPDLAVEVKSPSNSKREMQALAAMYLNAGARLVWLIDMEKKLVTVYRMGGTRFEVSGPAELDGYDVLPGFKLNLAAMFALVADD